ncbi:ParB/RepB/Spo0J family partition protein [Nisaea sp.]|uniref:ParB/RepB/Spo0J family partition protein n=1 Tax=Nisaea sp. TaxID=2024842 RepID=UPI0032EE66CC
MSIRLVVRDLLDVATECGLEDYPYWAGSERRITDADINRALAEDRLIAPDDNRDPNTPMSADDHAARVAWLVRHGDRKRMSIIIRNGRLCDGNHRFAACLFAGIEYVRCVMMETEELAAAA